MCYRHGYEKGKILAYLAEVDLNLVIDTVNNPNWKLPIGRSVLQSKALNPAGEDFPVSMSDPLYGHRLLKRIASSGMLNLVANVRLDFQPNRIFDLEDGIKISVDPDHSSIITGMSKDLQDYQAIDCGLFKCRYEFFDLLAETADAGEGSVASACNLAISDRKLGGVDIGDYYWIDIDTPEAVRYAQGSYVPDP